MSRNSFFITALAILFWPSQVLGCLNGATKILKNHFLVYVDGESRIPFGHNFDTSEESKIAVVKELDSLYQLTKDVDYLSDKGYLLVVLGRYKEAIDLFLTIEAIQPERYSTAANLGTAYELVGQNENALRWINRAIEINSASHFHSEWIHAKILQAKIKGEKYITSEFLLDTNFGSDEFPTSKLPEKQLEQLDSALYYQLNERVSFIKTEDKIVALLLFELGNVEFLLGNRKEAYEDYKIAKRYGFSEPLINARMAAAQKTPQPGFLSYPILFVIGMLILTGIFYVVIRRTLSSNYSNPEE